MSALTHPLREEHRQLLPHIEMLRTIANATGEMPLEVFRDDLDTACVFLESQLLSHAQAEERALYPVVARLLGAPEATATMVRDHEEIALLARELDALRQQLTGIRASDAEIKALRRVLYGLYAIIKLHLAKEEELYLPLLDARLTPEQGQAMFEELEKAAQAARMASQQAADGAAGVALGAAIRSR